MMNTSFAPAVMNSNMPAVDLVHDQQDIDWEVSEVEFLNRSGSMNSSRQDEDSFYETYSWSTEFMMRHSPAVSSVYCIAYTIVFTMGIIGNSCVVAVVLRSPRMRTVTNYFLVNLALADILVLLFCLPATLLSNLFIPWLLGLFMCKAVSYLQGVAVSASINTLVAVSADRCQMTRTTARKIILVIWLFSLAIAVPWALYFDLRPIDPKLPDVMLCNEKWPGDGKYEMTYFVIANLCLCYLIPLVVITACYLAIWLKVWRRQVPGLSETRDSKSGKSLNLQMDLLMQRSKLKVAKMMVVVVVIFVISWLPLYCVFTRFKLGGPFEEGSFEEWLFLTIAPIAQWLGASNSCINPVLYAFFNKKYRKGFAAIIKSKRCCGTIRADGASTASAYYRHGTMASRSTRRMTRSTRVDTADYVHPGNGNLAQNPPPIDPAERETNPTADAEHH